MFQIFIGSLFLSLIHVLIPNHWLPLVTVSKAEKWSQNRTIWATTITGFSHTLSTILIGVVVGIIGYKLSWLYQSATTIAAPVILAGLGIVYLVLDFRANRHHHHHHFSMRREAGDKSKWRAMLVTLSVAMFLTPCIEIEAYYFQAGTIGWTGIFIVSAVYLFVTVITMLILVFLGLKGIQNFNFHFLEHHEKGLAGIVLIGLGLLALFVSYR